MATYSFSLCILLFCCQLLVFGISVADKHAERRHRNCSDEPKVGSGKSAATIFPHLPLRGEACVAEVEARKQFQFWHRKPKTAVLSNFSHSALDFLEKLDELYKELLISKVSCKPASVRQNLSAQFCQSIANSIVPLISLTALSYISPDVANPLNLRNYFYFQYEAWGDLHAYVKLAPERQTVVPPCLKFAVFAVLPLFVAILVVSGIALRSMLTAQGESSALMIHQFHYYIINISGWLCVAGMSYPVSFLFIQPACIKAEGDVMEMYVARPMHYLLQGTGLLSNLYITMLFVDRAFALRAPVLYRNLFTSKRAALACVMALLLNGLLTVSQYLETSTLLHDANLTARTLQLIAAAIKGSRILIAAASLMVLSIAAAYASVKMTSRIRFVVREENISVNAFIKRREFQCFLLILSTCLFNLTALFPFIAVDIGDLAYWLARYGGGWPLLWMSHQNAVITVYMNVFLPLVPFGASMVFLLHILLSGTYRQHLASVLRLGQFWRQIQKLAGCSEKTRRVRPLGRNNVELPTLTIDRLITVQC